MIEWSGLREAVLEEFAEAQGKGRRGSLERWIGVGVARDNALARSKAKNARNHLVDRHLREMRPRYAVVQIAEALGPPGANPWTPEQERACLEMGLRGDAWEDVARAVGRSVGAVKERFAVLSIASGVRRPRRARLSA